MNSSLSIAVGEREGGAGKCWCIMLDTKETVRSIRLSLALVCGAVMDGNVGDALWGVMLRILKLVVGAFGGNHNMPRRSFEID